MSITYEDVLNDLETGRIYTAIFTSANKAWFKYCYHFSHIENVISILEDGELLSRTLAISTKKMLNNNASQAVIDQTKLKYQDYVRLYFRPKTPTQFHNEGFKTKKQLEQSSLDAQCPVPVFLFLDIRKVLNHPDALFTEKGLASGDEVLLYSTPEEFKVLPFDKIYHDQPLTHEEKSTIVGHRHAEIILPNRFPIKEYLQKIVVRTPAEKETLLALMSSRVKDEYGHLIQIDSTNNIFFSRWTHVGKVNLHQNSFDLEFRSSSKYQKFDLSLEFTDVSGTPLTHDVKDWKGISKSSFNFQSPHDEYELTIRFDGHLMYKGYFKQEENIPF